MDLQQIWYVAIAIVLLVAFLWFFQRIAGGMKRWIAAQREKAIDRRTARAAALDEGKEHDLVLLYEQGFVQAGGTGQSITRVYGKVENLTRRRIRVVITPGTYFVASGNYQNMVTRSRYTFTLDPLDSESVTIDATCINAGRPIPGEKDFFLGVKRVSTDLCRFLEEARNADAMTVQAGVWAITDGYSGQDVQNHLVSRDQRGNTRSAVSGENIAEARRILSRLGIRTRL